jgi:hypothetical protein
VKEEEKELTMRTSRSHYERLQLKDSKVLPRTLLFTKEKKFAIASKIGKKSANEMKLYWSRAVDNHVGYVWISTAHQEAPIGRPVLVQEILMITRN